MKKTRQMRREETRQAIKDSRKTSNDPIVKDLVKNITITQLNLETLYQLLIDKGVFTIEDMKKRRDEIVASMNTAAPVEKEGK